MRSQNYGNGTRRRVMIFIDGSNLYHVLKQNTDKQNLDYKKFAQKLCGDRELIRTYYYNIRQESFGNSGPSEGQDRFLNALYETDYLEVKLGILKQRGNTMVEKGVDVMIAADLIAHAYEDHYDTAILVSGDADFYPALQAVKDTGKQVEVAAFDSNLSSEAARMADVLIKFDRGYFDSLWMSAGQQHNNVRIAEKRKQVSDEAASPNGEDKGANREQSYRRKPFTDRYADRRNAYSSASSKNGHVATRPEPRARVPETRRSLSTVLRSSSGANARTDRRGLAAGTRSRAVQPDRRTVNDRVPPDSSSDELSAVSERDRQRESWISKMFGSRK